jgi:hypothetical protein
MLALLLAAVTLALPCAKEAQGAPALSKRVTFEARAASLRKIIEAIAERTGAPLSCPSSLEGEIVAVRASDVLLADLMERIAEATTTRWEYDGKRYVLARDRVRARDQERPELDERVSALRESLKPYAASLPVKYSGAFVESERQHADALRKSLDIQAPPAEYSQRLRSVYAAFISDPGTRALMRVLSRTDPRKLVALRCGERIVLSSAPTRAQHPIPGAASILSDFVREQSIWVDWLRHSGQSMEAPPEPQRPEWRVHQPLLTRPHKVLVAIDRLFDSARLTPSLSLFDVDGNATYALSGIAAMPLLLDDNPPLKPLEAPEQIELWEDSKSLIDDLSSRSRTTKRGIERLGSSLPWRRRLAQPEREDFLSFVPTDAAFSVAKAHGRNLVASISDLNGRLAFFIGRSAVFGSPSLVDFVHTHSGPDAGGWCVITPNFAARARENRTDRRELGKLLRRVLADGRLSLESWSEFLASKRRWDPAESLGHRLISYCFVDLSRPRQTAQSPLGYQHYGSLTRAQRVTVLSGGEIPYTLLSLVQKEYAADMVFGTGALFGLLSRPTLGGGAASSLAGEPTEVFASGVLAGGASLRIARESRLLPRGVSSGDPDWYGLTDTAEGLGPQTYERKNAQPGAYPFSIDLYKVAQERALTPSLAASPRIMPQVVLSELPDGWSERAYAPDEMPEHYRSAFARGWKLAEEEHVNRPPPPAR